MNIVNLSALELGRQIACKKITSAESVQFYIDRNLKFKDLNCISELFETEALEQAKHLDELIQKGTQLSPFHGVPILLKDNLDVAGYITHAGTVYLDKIAQANCELADQLQALGFVILGKTKMTELAFGLSGQNPMQGTPKNPWAEQQFAPGGSSSGSAVAVASGLCPMAFGGDTGGSIRTPATLNGVFGFKPSSYQIAGHGAVPLSKTLDTLGPFSRFADDISALFPLLSKVSAESASAENVIYALDESTFPYPLEPEVLALWCEGLKRIESLGIEIKAWQPPLNFDFQDLSDRTSDIIAYESYLYHGDSAENHEIPMWELVRQRILRGKTITSQQYESLIAERIQFQQDFEASLNGQCLLFPVSPFISAVSNAADTEFSHVGEYTRPFNYLDAPSYAFPIAQSANGLPMGIQLASYLGNDVEVMNTVQKIANGLNIRSVLPPRCQD